MFLVVPKEPLQAGREYEFEFHYSGKVIHDAGEHVFYVSARGNWYPASGMSFATFDLRFRYPREYDLVSVGDTLEEKQDGEWRTVHRRTSAPVRLAAFNLGDYEHARVEKGGYVVDVCANRRLERALQPRPPELPPAAFPTPPGRRRPDGAEHGASGGSCTRPVGTAEDTGRRSGGSARVHDGEVRSAGAAAPDGVADSRDLRPGVPGADLPFDAVLSQHAAGFARRHQPVFGDLLSGHAAGARDRASVVGQPYHQRQLSRQLADGGAGELLGAAIPGEAPGQHGRWK